MVKVICHKAASPPQMDGSVVFARWHQRALPWGHTGATWRIRLNLCFLRPTQVHNTNGKSIGSAILHSSRQRVVGRARACPSPNNCPFWAPSNTCFLGPIRVDNPNGISIGSAIFAQLTASRHCEE